MVDAGKEEREADAKRRLGESRAKRAVKERVRAAKAQGSLGERLAAEGEGKSASTADWALRMREKRTNDTTSTATVATAKATDPVSSTAAAGPELRVSHGQDDIAAGGSVIMTLQERPMLDAKGRLLDEDNNED